MIITTLTKDQTATKINLSKSPGTKGVSGNTSTHTKSPTGTRRFISKNPGGTVISLTKNDLQEYPATTAQFPELIEGFTAAGISGGTLTGVLGVITVTDGTGWVQPSTGRFRGQAANQTTAGTWGAIGTKYGLMIATGSFAASTDATRLGIISVGSSYLINKISAGTASLTSGTNQITSATDITGPTAPFKSKALLVDQSSATGWAFKYAVDSLNTGYMVPLTTLTGDISASYAAFSSGANGAVFTNDADSYYEGVWLFALNSRPSNELIFTAMQWMSDHPGFAYPGFANTSLAGSTMGVNSILGTSAAGLANILMGIKCTLASAKRCLSISQYITVVGGNMRLGVYSDASGIPGNKLGETDEYTPKLGWNNVSLKTPASLPAGDYWLVYHTNNSSVTRTYETAGNRYYKSTAYGPLPSVFPDTGTADVIQDSLYALLV